MTTTLLVRRLKRVSKEMRTLVRRWTITVDSGKWATVVRNDRRSTAGEKLDQAHRAPIPWPLLARRPIRQTLNRRGHRLARLLAASKVLK